MNGIERLVWVVPPPARVAAGSDELSVSVKIADDMGRTVLPMSDVPVTLRWALQTSAMDDTDAASSASLGPLGQVSSGISGSSILDDPFLLDDDEFEDEEAELDKQDGVGSRGVLTLSIAPPPIEQLATGSKKGTLVLEASVAPPAGCDPPWKDEVPTLVLPCHADVEVVDGEDTSENDLDTRGSGHGTKETHGTVWDCGLILAAYLSTAAGKVVLEKAQEAIASGAIGIDVGCGAGVAGLALAHVVPDLKVILTDIGAGIDLATRNVAASPMVADRVEVKELWWGTGKEADATGGAKVALLVASDVVYDADATGPLAATLAALCGPDTICILGFRNRTSAQNIREFFEKLSALGLSQVAVPKGDLDPAFRADDAHLLLLSRK